jgi:hypothetical protein
MRFATRVDRWLFWVLAVTAVVTSVVMPAVVLTASGASAVSRALSLLPLLIWLIVLPATLPQYYELRDDGLFLRRGWSRKLIPYASLTEVRSIVSSLSAPVFSTHRLTLDTRENRQFLIAVAEEDRFLDELSSRTPQLQRTGFGLSLSLSATK